VLGTFGRRPSAPPVRRCEPGQVMRGIQPQLRPIMQPPPPTGCTGKAPPGGAPGAVGTAGAGVPLDEAPVVALLPSAP
jgi:hypothetical protein